jgi:hypothetical protein
VVEIAIAKLKSYKLQGDVQIPAEMMRAGGEALGSLRSSGPLILFGIKKNCVSVEEIYYCSNSQEGR